MLITHAKYLLHSARELSVRWRKYEAATSPKRNKKYFLMTSKFPGSGEMGILLFYYFRSISFMMDLHHVYSTNDICLCLPSCIVYRSIVILIYSVLLSKVPSLFFFSSHIFPRDKRAD